MATFIKKTTLTKPRVFATLYLAVFEVCTKNVEQVVVYRMLGINCYFFVISDLFFIIINHFVKITKVYF